MSKPIKELVRKEVARRFEGVTSAAVVDVTGIDAVSMNQLRGKLAAKSVRVMIVKNALAKQVFKAAGQQTMADILEGPCALAYATDGGKTSVVSVVRELLEIAKTTKALKVKGAVLEGDGFGTPEAVEALSKFPTRDEALGKVVGAMLGAGGKLVAAVLSGGAKVAGILKTIEDKAPKDAQAPAAEAPAAEATPAGA
jgi:large subunit ribosomal protein L10